MYKQVLDISSAKVKIGRYKMQNNIKYLIYGFFNLELLLDTIRYTINLLQANFEINLKYKIFHFSRIVKMFQKDFIYHL